MLYLEYKEKRFNKMTKLEKQKQNIANEYAYATMMKDDELVLTAKRLTNSVELDNIEENLANLTALVAYYNQALVNAKNK